MQQTPMRFYIQQGDDRPVVRTVPVPKPAAEPTTPSSTETRAVAPVVDERPAQRAGALKRLVRVAARQRKNQS
ncbi:MAG TPA: hypothetical protein VIL01_01015 [Thermomicrobiales bacterium]